MGLKNFPPKISKSDGLGNTELKTYSEESVWLGMLCSALLTQLESTLYPPRA